jgi:hypothetical protein
MMPIVLFGIGVILLSIVINIVQVQPGLKALAELNETTYSFSDKMLYPFRFICIMPKLLGPILLDIIVVGIGGSVGLGGGVIGFIIGMSASCLLSMAIKLSLAINKNAAKRRAL